MKLWDKGTEINKFIEAFTIGKDTEMDYFLAEFDVLGSLPIFKCSNRLVYSQPLN